MQSVALKAWLRVFENSFNTDQSQKGFTATVLFDTLQSQHDKDMTGINKKKKTLTGTEQ